MINRNVSIVNNHTIEVAESGQIFIRPGGSVFYFKNLTEFNELVRETKRLFKNRGNDE